MADSTDHVLRGAWQATRLRRAFQPANPSQRLDLAVATACWRALGTFAAEKLTDGRGAVLPKLGTFVLLHSGSGGRTDGGPRTPTLQLSRELTWEGLGDDDVAVLHEVAALARRERGARGDGGLHGRLGHVAAGSARLRWRRARPPPTGRPQQPGSACLQPLQG